MMVIFGSLSGLYIIPTIYEDYADLDHAAENKGSLDDGNVPAQAGSVDDFARSAISSVYHKAKELKTNSSVVGSAFVFL